MSGAEPGKHPARTRRAWRRPAALSALALGVGAAIVGSPTRATQPESARGIASATVLATEIEEERDHVTALELASWIRSGKPGLRVLDVRPDSEYAAYHIPSAERVSLRELATLAPRTDATLVLYSAGGAHAAQGWVLLRAAGHDDVYFLSGGLLEWMDDVMNPVVGGAGADSVASLSRYFGGVPRVGDATAVTLPAAPLRATGTASAAVARARRRGC